MNWTRGKNTGHKSKCYPNVYGKEPTITKFEENNELYYLPDIKTASYWLRPAASTRCFNLLSDGSTSKAGCSAKEGKKSNTKEMPAACWIIIYSGRSDGRSLKSTLNLELWTIPIPR